MNEMLLKTSGADVLFSRKKLRKTLWDGTPFPPPLVRPRVNSWNFHFDLLFVILVNTL